MRFSYFHFPFIILLTCSSVMAALSAEHEPVGIVKERIDTMAAMGKSVGVIVDMIKGKTNFDTQLATQAASDILDYSLDASKQFPDTDQSKNGKNSRALPSIWKERADFDLYLSNLQNESELLAQVSAMNQPDLIRPRFAEVVEICSACHEKYRRPKN